LGFDNYGLETALQILESSWEGIVTLKLLFASSLRVGKTNMGLRGVTKHALIAYPWVLSNLFPYFFKIFFI
jgi:hypothetical protein